jgi:hypothetical protein
VSCLCVLKCYGSLYQDDTVPNRPASGNPSSDELAKTVPEADPFMEFLFAALAANVTVEPGEVPFHLRLAIDVLRQTVRFARIDD